MIWGRGRPSAGPTFASSRQWSPCSGSNSASPTRRARGRTKLTIRRISEWTGARNEVRFEVVLKFWSIKSFYWIIIARKSADMMYNIYCSILDEVLAKKKIILHEILVFEEVLSEIRSSRTSWARSWSSRTSCACLSGSCLIKNNYKMYL